MTPSVVKKMHLFQRVVSFADTPPGGVKTSAWALPFFKLAGASLPTLSQHTRSALGGFAPSIRWGGLDAHGRPTTLRWTLRLVGLSKSPLAGRSLRFLTPLRFQKQGTPPLFLRLHSAHRTARAAPPRICDSLRALRACWEAPAKKCTY